MRGTPSPRSPRSARPTASLRRRRRPAPRWLVVVLVGLLAGVVALPVAAPPADAAVIRSFTKVYSTQTNGSIQLTGNTLMTCSPTGTNGSQCAGTLAGNLDQGNNGLTMVRLDVDNDATTASSSTANLTLPTGATVLKAYLFWGASASLGTATSTTIKFRTPSGGYQTLTSDVVDKQGTAHYSAYRDVTSLVQASGTYGAADVVLTDNQSDRYAGWNLAVVVADPNAPLRDLSVFSGYASVSSGETANASISGFLTPPSGTVNSRVGMVVYEGDKQLTGDQFTINGTAQSDGSTGSTTNFFSSRISSDGTILTNRNPAYVNSLGTEAKSFTTTSIPNNATSANLSFTSNGDVYFPAALTTQVDLYAPQVSGTKTVTNLTRGSGTAQVGDTLRYSLSYTNTGDDNATNSVIRDVLPGDVTYVPGSIRVTAGANTGAKTDAAGDDVGEYVAATRTVRVRAGTGASATAGGTLAKGTVQTITFDVTLDASSAGTTITNVGLLDYRAPQIGRDYTYTTGPVETPVAPRADLALTKSALPEPVDAGAEITYTLGVTNNGPNPATGTVVTDTLPADTTFVSATPSSGSCTQVGGTVTCNLGTVPNGANRTITVVARVRPAFEGTGVTNVASVTSEVSDPVAGNNSASAVSTVTTSADVAVTKVGTPTNPVPGRDVTYTVVATNNGPSTARAVVVSDTLPAAFLTSPAVTATTTDGTCTVTGRGVACPVGLLGPGASATITITARLDPGYAGGAIANTATVSTTTLDRTLGNNSATATNTPAAPQADLSIDKTTTTSPVVPGRPVQYVVTVTNDGPSDATGVRVTDTPPATLTGVTANPSQGSCTSAVVCTLGAIPAGGSATITIDATVAPGATGSLANTASVTATTADPDGSDNSDTATDSLQPRADVRVTKTAPPTTPGSPVTYTVTATNRGPSVATGVVVTDPVPSPLTLQSATSDRGGCTTSGAAVRCTVGTLAVGETATITIVAGTPPDGSGTGAVNTATASAATTDPDTTNNSASQTLTGGAQANVSLQKTASPSPAVAGGPISFTLAATNNGPSNAGSLTITDTVPANVAIGVLPADCTRSGQQVTCTRATLVAGVTWTVVIPGTVTAATTPGTIIVNSAQVSIGSPVDPSPGDNTATSRTPVVARADLEMTKTGPATVTAGGLVDYTLAVRNIGPSDATDVQVLDDLPGTATFVSSAACAPVAGSPGTLSCDLGTVPAGQTATATVRVRIDPALTGGSVANTARVSSSTTDPVTANNASTTTATVQTRTDLTVAKTVTPNPLVAGRPATYTVTVTNNGPSDAAGVSLTDTLPGGVTLTATDAGGGTCSGTAAVTCTRPVLAAGATWIVRLQVAVGAGTTANQVNQARVTSTTTELVPADNQTSISTPVTAAGDLEIVKTVSPSPLVAGQQVTYTLTVVNYGPADMVATTVADPLPPALSGVTATVSPTAAGTCTTAGGALACNLGTLADGPPVKITVTGLLVPAFTGASLSNTATVDSTTDDLDATNDQSSVTSGVQTRADLSVVKTASVDPIVAGEQFDYTLTVSNAGPSVARAAVVRDTVPVGLSVVSATVVGGPACAVDGRAVECALGDLPPGGTPARVTLTVLPDADPPATRLVNRATVDSDTTDPATDNDTDEIGLDVVTRADLVVTKTRTAPATGPVVPGQRVTWTLAVTNPTGPSAARGVTVTDAVDPRLTGVTATGAGGGCTVAADNRVTCSLGRVAVGAAPVTVTVSALVPADFTGPLANTATVGATTPDPDPSDNSATVTEAPVGRAGVSVVKARTSGPVVPGRPVSWDVVVTNAGPSVAAAVTVTDDVADALTGVTATLSGAPAGATCTVGAANAVECALGAMPVGTATVTVTGQVPASYTGALDNTAVVDSPTDTTPGDNTSTSTGTAQPSADLAVAKTRSSGPVVPGSRVTWQVTVDNLGPSRATGVVVTDDVLDALTGVTATVAGRPDACTVAAGGPTPNLVRCELGAVAPGDPLVTITIGGDLPAGFTGRADNTAEVTSAVPDPAAGNNSATVDGSASPRADVSVTKTRTTPVVPGTDLSWTIVVRNAGPSSATDVDLVDELLDDLTDITVDAPASAGCRVGAAKVLRCDIATLGPNQTVSVVVGGRLPADFTGNAANTATVTSPVDTTPGNNTDTAPGRAVANADVSVTKTRTSGPVVPGTRVSWDVVVSNAGPSVARDVTLTDDVLDALTGVTVTPAALDCAVAAGNRVSCDLGTLTAAGAGRSVTVTISGLLPASYTGAVDNTAVVDSPPDTTPANNTATSSGTAAPDAAVSVSKTRTSGPVVPGRSISWDVVVTNAGPSVARDVTLDDDVADELTGLTVTPAGLDCTVGAGNAVSCDLGDLPATGAGRTVTVTLTAQVPADYTGALDNTATIDSPTDTKPDDNSATSTGTARPEADVSVSKTRTSGPVVPGRPVSWDVVVTNGGPSVAREVTLDDDVADELTGLTVTPAGLCDLGAGNVVSCDLGDLPATGAGRSVTVTLTAQVPADYTGALDNTATIDSQADPNPVNDTATSTGTAQPQADVSVSKTRTSGPVVPGRPVSWDVVVTNAGPSVARDVTLDDNLVDQLTGVVVDAPPGVTCTETGSNEVSCDLGDLPATGAGSSVTVTITGDVPPGYTGALDNTATIDSPTDTSPGNDTSTSTGTAQPNAAVSVTKTRTSGPVVPGRDVEWRLVVRNDGPSVARSVTLDDDVADAITRLTVAPAGVDCTVTAGNVVACDLGDLPASGPGSEVVLTLSGGVPAGFTGDLDNTAAVDSPTDDTPDDNTSTSPGTAQPVAAVSIDKTRTSGPVVPGRDVTWQVTVTNAGPSVARQVEVEDVVPAALTGVTVDVAGAPDDACGLTAGTVVCDLGDLPASGAGSQVTLTITGALPAGYTGDLDNTATVTSPTDDTPDDNTSTSTGTAAPDADVSITKSRPSGEVVAGDPVTWEVVVTNNGPSVARGVVVDDEVATALTLVTATTDSGATCTVSPTNVVRCPLGDLAVGDEVVVTIEGEVPPSYTGRLDNTATVSSPTDTTPSNNTATIPGDATSQADVNIVKARTSGPVVPGQAVTWTLTVANAGPSDATAVVVTDDVLDALTGVTATGPAGVTCTVGAGNLVTCSLGTVEPRQRAVVTITGQVPASYVGGASNTAVVETTPPDTNTADNTSTTDGVAQPEADVSIVKTRTSGAVVPGRPVSWQVTVRNAGPSTATGVVVRDDVIDALTDVTVDAPAGVRCTVGAGNEVECPLGELAPSGAGSTAVVTISGVLPADFTGDASNTATVASPVDSTDGNNSSTAPGTAQAQADVSVAKTRTSGPIVPGRPVAWSVVVTNAGPSVARTVVVTDDLADELTGVVVAPAGLGCTVGAGNAVRCELGDLPATGAGSRVTITVTADVPADYTGDLSNTAEVDSPTDTTTPDNDTSTSPGTAQPAADVSITKTRTVGPIVPGRPVEWQVVVRNAGPSVARDVVVTDDLVDALTGLDVAPAGLCTTGAGNALRCELGDLPAGGAGSTVTITIGADVPADYTGALANTAVVDSPTDTTPDNDSDTSPGTAQPAADVSVTKTRTVGPIVPGRPVAWEVVVRNAGPSVARDVVLTDDLVDALTNVEITPAGRCTIGAGNAVRCALGDLPATGAGATVTISITADVPADYTGDLSNTAEVDSPTDTTPGNDSDTSPGTARPDADVSVQKTRTSGPVVPGRPVSWSVVVTNGGPSVARDVVLTDDLVDALTGVTVTPAALGCTVVEAGNLVRCELGDLPASGAGSSVAVTITAGVPAGYTGDLDNTAVVESPTDTTTPGNDTSTSPGTAQPDADVSVTKTRTSGAIVPGESVSWDVVVTNGGPSTARDVVLTDDLADELTDVDVTPAALGCTIGAGNAVRCELGDLPATGAGSAVTITITADVPADYTGDLSNTAVVDSPTDTTTPDNDTATSPGTATGAADVSVTKTRTSGPVVAGDTVSWDVVVTNAGPSVARDVVLTDDLVDELTAVDVTPAALGCTIGAGNEVRCELGDLAASGPGSTVTVTITAEVPDDYAGALDNTAAVDSPTDTTPGNDTATSPGNAEGLADLSITKVLVGEAVPGGRVTWRLEIANAGPSVARDVVISDPMPAAVSGARAVAPAGTTCSVQAATLTCTVPVLRPGDTVALTVSGLLAPGAVGRLVNTATVVGTQPDPSPVDNTATTTDPMAPSADLAVTKAVAPAAPLQGEEVTFSLTVRNLGPSTATGATLRDPMPRGLLDVRVTADGGARCDVGPEGGREVVDCRLPAIAPGARLVVRVTARVAERLEGTLTNTVVVAPGAQPDPVTANNSDTVTTGAVEGADLAVTKVALAESVDADTRLGYRLTVTNAGPATARDVELVDRLPDGLTVAATEVRPAGAGSGCAAEDGDTVLRCQLGDLAVGDSVTVELTVDVGDDVAGPVENTAEVRAETGDPSLADNADDATVVVVAVNDGGDDTDDPDGDGTGDGDGDGDDDGSDGGLPGTGAGPWLLPLLLAALGSLAAGLLLMRRSRRS